MTNRIRELRNFFAVEKKHRSARKPPEVPSALAEEFRRSNIPEMKRAVLRLKYMLDNETPVVFGNERIALTRTIPRVPELYTEEEMAEIKSKYRLHERGEVCNINVDYSMLLDVGFDKKRAEIRAALQRLRKSADATNIDPDGASGENPDIDTYGASGENHNNAVSHGNPNNAVSRVNPDSATFHKNHDNAVCGENPDIADSCRYLEHLLSILDSVEGLASRYREKAEETGNMIVAESFGQIPAGPPKSFLQALQMLRLLHFTMWCVNNYHNTLGRFDQYMYKFLKNDMDNGILDYDGALELVEEFFISLNRDSDLYPGMQQGDNGQSLVLGGLEPDGSDSYNLLSELCLKASLELKLIDPKINLRVSKSTPPERYELATMLTKQGLGFPQYSNDDVVIDGLTRLGYDRADAHNYVVAACWEFIIPGRGMDIPNIDALSFVKAVADATLEGLKDCRDYDEFENLVMDNIRRQADEICRNTENVHMFPAPFLSLMMEGCVENARDISMGCRYNNYGIHGTGISTAVDSMAAIKKYVFETGLIDKEILIDALNNNFAGYEAVRIILRNDAPKFGNNDDYVDSIAVRLLDAFARSLEGKRNDRGGVFRPGTGSAMYYIWHSRNMKATADGRNCGEEFAANYSPSLFARLNGPVSIIRSFTKPDLKRVINGGPLTLELHETVFRTEEAIKKVAMFVKSFIDMGGHQLQLNSVNLQTLLDAREHPEKHRNLIVRVWGWSGYFVELSREYQDHIIKRAELMM